MSSDSNANSEQPLNDGFERTNDTTTRMENIFCFSEIKTLPKNVLSVPCEDICCICMNTHTKYDTIMTDCGHEFGMKCYVNWINSNNNQNCPNCRKYLPKCTIYNPPGSRRRNKAIVEDDDDDNHNQ
jgi:hypothetical protein